MTIVPATESHIPVLALLDRHIAPSELTLLVRMGRVLVAEQDGEIRGWLRWKLFWDNTSISTRSWDMIPSAALHPSVTPLN